MNHKKQNIMKKTFLLMILLLVAEVVVAQDTTDSSTVYNRGSHQLGLFVAPSIGSKVSSHYFLLKHQIQKFHYFPIHHHIVSHFPK